MAEWKIPYEERPRERAKKLGLRYCTNSELIAMILGTGGRNIHVSDLSYQIMNDYPLAKLKDVTVNELKHYNGMGDVRSLTLLAAIELGQRIANYHSDSIILRCSKDVYKYYKPKISPLDHEELWICSLNIQNEIIGEHLISSGGLHATSCDMSLMYKKVLKDGAVSIVLIHNHPSGHTQPSADDDYVTQKALEGGMYLHINMMDHVIVGKNNYYSYRDQKRLELNNDNNHEEQWLKNL